MKKIMLFFVLVLNLFITSGCQDIASTYVLYVNTSNPIKSLVFFEQSINSSFIGYFELEDDVGLAVINYETYSDKSEKIYYRLIAETQTYTPDVYQLIEIHPMGGRLMGYALYENQTVDYHMRSDLSSGYDYSHQLMDDIIMHTPLNRFVVLSDLTDYLSGGALTLDNYASHQILDYTYDNFNAVGYFSGYQDLLILLLKDQTLSQLKLSHPDDTLLVEETIISAHVLDAYFIANEASVLYIDDTLSIHMTNQEKTLSLDDIMTFESFTVYEEHLDLTFHMIETTTELSFYDNQLGLLLTIDKDLDFTYVGINPYTANGMAYVSFYYLDHGHLLKDYKYVAHLR